MTARRWLEVATVSRWISRSVIWIALWSSAAVVHAQDVSWNVVLVMDTSESMAASDPDRRALLVTTLLSDLLEGPFAVIRLRSLGSEIPFVAPAIPGTVPCSDRPGQLCDRADLAPHAEADAHDRRPGTLTRTPGQADAFRARLEAHLAPTATNSLFSIAFTEAIGLYDAYGPPPALERRVLVWLFDGESEGGAAPLLGKLRTVQASKVQIEPLLFGVTAKDDILTQAGLPSRAVRTADALLPQFTAVFQRLVGAAHTTQDRLATQPGIEIKPGVDDAWVIVTGDATLTAASLIGADGPVQGKLAAYNHPTAGAYRALHVRRPKAGRYQLSAVGGGSGVAYAVIQTASIRPFLIEPGTAALNVPARTVVELRGRDGQRVVGSAIPAGAKVSVEVAGKTIPLTAQTDGTFHADVTYASMGTVPVRIRLSSDILDRVEEQHVTVSGRFRYAGGVQRVDFGQLGVSGISCRSLRDTEIDQVGPVTFDVRQPSPLPEDHALVARNSAAPASGGRGPAPGGSHASQDGILTFIRQPGEAIALCLETGPSAASSTATDQRVTLVARGYPGQAIPVDVTWHVQGLTWWQRYGWIVLTLIAIAAAIAVALGYYTPHRWPRGLAVSFAPTLADLDLLRPVPIKTWKGTGIGFYRDARAYLHPDLDRKSVV